MPVNQILWWFLGCILKAFNAKVFLLSFRTSNIRCHYPHLLQKPSPHPPPTAAIQNHSIHPALHSVRHLTSLSTSGYHKFHHSPLSPLHTPQCLFFPRQGPPARTFCLPANYLCSASSCSSSNMLDSTTLLLEGQLQIKPSSCWCLLVVMEVSLYLAISLTIIVNKQQDLFHLQ